MNTFISDYDLTKNAANLDGKRLFKQLLEGKQILDVLVNNKKSWSNHPAVNQWRGYELGLFFYIESIWEQLQNKKIALNSKLYGWCKAQVLINKLANKTKNKDIYPKWWGRADILESHRSRLKCKGLIDVYCAAIKKHLKIKKIDAWLKKYFNKTKNQLKYPDAQVLYALIIQLNIKNVEPSHYDRKDWAKIPYDLEYVWPAYQN